MFDADNPIFKIELFYVNETDLSFSFLMPK